MNSICRRLSSDPQKLPLASEGQPATSEWPHTLDQKPKPTSTALTDYEKANQFSSLKDMARHYVEAIRTVQDQGPYSIMGYSFGSNVALEMAEILKSEHQCPDTRLVLVDLFDHGAVHETLTEIMCYTGSAAAHYLDMPNPGAVPREINLLLRMANSEDQGRLTSYVLKGLGTKFLGAFDKAEAKQLFLYMLENLQNCNELIREHKHDVWDQACNVLLLQSEENAYKLQDWNTCFRALPENHVINSSNHFNILLDPLIADVTNIIQRFFEKSHEL